MTLLLLFKEMRPPVSCVIHLNARRPRTADAVRPPTNIEAMVGMSCTRAGTGRSAARALLWAVGVAGGFSAHAFVLGGWWLVAADCLATVVILDYTFFHLC